MSATGQPPDLIAHRPTQLRATPSHTHGHRSRHCPRPPKDECERGSLMLYMVPIAFVLLLFAGLVFDGGTALAARGRAADLAAQAARAGADALSPASLRAVGPAHPRIDPAGAQAAGRRVLSAAGATGTITVHGTDVVSVTARVRARTAILSAIGFDDASGTATATATILHGITTATGGP